MKIKRVVPTLECLIILISLLNLGPLVYLPTVHGEEISSIFVVKDSQGINVTLSNRFELYFNSSNGGEISRYYDLVANPARSENLVLPPEDYWDWIPAGMLPLFTSTFYKPSTGDFASTGRDRDASVSVLGQGTGYVILQSISRILNQTDSLFTDAEGKTNYINSTWLIRDDGYIFVERTLYTPTYSVIPSGYRWYPFYAVRTRGFADNATFYLFNTTYAYTNVVSNNYTNVYNKFPVIPSDQNGIVGVASPFNNTSLGGDGTHNMVIVYNSSEISDISEWRSDNYIRKSRNETGGTEFGATHEFDSNYIMRTNTLRAMIALTHQAITEQNVTNFANDFKNNPVFPLIETTLSTNKSVYEIGDPLSVNVSATAHRNLTNLNATLTQTNSTRGVTFYENYGVFNYPEDQSWFLTLLDEKISNDTAAGNYTFTFRLISTLGIVLASDSEIIQIVSDTFGNTNVGKYQATSYACYEMVSRYLMPRSGIVTSVSMWFGNVSFDARVAIYIHPTGDLIVQSQSEPITTEGWHNFTIPQTFLQSGFYGLAWKNSKNALVAYDPGELKQTARSPKPEYDDFSEVFGEPEFYNIAMSIYATYMPTGAEIGTLRYPETPNYDEEVTVIANVKNEESKIGPVTLSYSINQMEWDDRAMLLSNGSYTAEIPSQPYNETVYYKVCAYDIYGDFLAESSIYSYIVTDTNPPTVSYLEPIPSSPNYNDTVSMFANVTEPINASGVKLVLLGYWNGSAWTDVEMTLETSLYKATLPAMPYATTVNYTLQAFDYAENVASMGVYSYTVDDRYLPIARIDAPISGSYLSGGVDIIVFANDTNIDKVELSINDSLVLPPWDSSGQYIFEWNSKDWTDGVYQLKLTVFDKAKNVAEKQIQVIVDNESPLATINSPESRGYIRDVFPIMITGDDTNFEKMELYIAGETIETWKQPHSEVYYWRTTGYPDGDYFIKLIVYDKAKNTEEREILVTIDNTRPSADMNVPTVEGYVKGTVLISLTGDDTNFDQMELKIDEVTKQVWRDSNVQSYELNTESYPDGAHHITLTVFDKAGNIGEMRSAVTVDNTSPTIQTPVWEPLEPFTDDKVNIKVKISDSPSDTSIKNVTLWYRDVALDEWQLIEMSFTNGEWNATIPEQPQFTTIEFYVESYDKAGNMAKTSAFQCQVRAPPSNWTLAIVISFALISTALIGTTIYLIRRIKRKE